MEKMIRFAKDWGLTKIPKPLSLPAQRIQTYAIWKIDFKAEEFPTVTVDNSILKRLGLDPDNFDLEKVAQEMTSCRIHIVHDNGDWAITNLCSSFSKNGNEYQLSFDPVLSPLFMSLKGNYVSMSVHPLLNIGRYSHTYPLYQHLITRFPEGDTPVTQSMISLIDLRAVMGASESYPKWIDFKRYVIENAVGEINSNTDIFVEYKTIKGGKSGREVVSVRFQIKRKLQYQGQLFDLDGNAIDFDDEEKRDIPKPIANILLENDYKLGGKRTTKIEKILGKYSDSIVMQAIKLMAQTLRFVPAKERGAVLSNGLESVCESLQEVEDKNNVKKPKAKKQGMSKENKAIGESFLEDLKNAPNFHKELKELKVSKRLKDQYREEWRALGDTGEYAGFEEYAIYRFTGGGD